LPSSSKAGKKHCENLESIETALYAMLSATHVPGGADRERHESAGKQRLLIWKMGRETKRCRKRVPNYRHAPK
jgi:hypothetical protein